MLYPLYDFVGHLALKLYAKLSRNHYNKRLGSDSLVDNRRIPKSVHILQ